MLYLADGHFFATGMIHYLDHTTFSPALSPRLVVRIWLGNHALETIVDTGGLYFVCHPELAELCEPEFGPELRVAALNIRGHKVEGTLRRTKITLEAEKGQDLAVNVTAFIPQLDTGIQWPFPSFLGLQGCLEFLRFAVDPGQNAFYFGAM